ncbi:hypothetical protein UCRPC4_g03482 [Phaeomoniella chlamydospora]|uniref:Uncharacterized protein n=1 Tax=Phaeomoniella chlamydospora TaxID=158046 RepID=A0A0G2GYJ9_PHACM|nr:hypothetical protein UCRPC4_g03482 [Phaeomoniella chlamydospora]
MSAQAVSTGVMQERDPNTVAIPSTSQSTQKPVEKTAKKAGTGAVKKRSTKTPSPNTDLTNIHLEGEETGEVPIFDTCDDVRKKMRGFLKRKSADATLAGLARAISANVPPGDTVSGQNVKRFLDAKGIYGGSSTKAFYAGYIYFEKCRIRDGKPKSVKRQEMEIEWKNQGGFPRSSKRDPQIDEPKAHQIGYKLLGTNTQNKAKEKREKANEEGKKNAERKEQEEGGDGGEKRQDDDGDEELEDGEDDDEYQEGDEEVEEDHTESEQLDTEIEDDEDKVADGKQSSTGAQKRTRSTRSSKNSEEGRGKRDGDDGSAPSSKKQKTTKSDTGKKNANEDLSGSNHDKSTPLAAQGSNDRLPEKGNKVQWRAMRGWVKGEVTEILVSDKKVDGKDVKALKQDPRIVLNSDSRGKICVHKPDSIYID